MDPTKTHGAFSWNELTTTDPTAAASFYAGLFGWTVKDANMGGGSYLLGSLGETAVAGIMAPPPGAPPRPPAWGAYVTVDDVDATIARCIELGGQVLMPGMDVTGVGRMAVLQDPQGAVFNVMTYSA
jgi:predicted enzyme related to lactoylglutathione lyase